MTSPGRAVPSRCARRKASSIIATPPFISSAPRPQIYPSWRRPSKGGTSQGCAAVGTTSRWPYSSRGGASPRPRSRLTTFTRAASSPSSSAAMPASLSKSRHQTAHARSFPGGLVVSCRISACKMPAALGGVPPVGAPSAIALKVPPDGRQYAERLETTRQASSPGHRGCRHHCPGHCRHRCRRLRSRSHCRSCRRPPD